MTLKEIQALKQSYWNAKVAEVSKQSREAKAVMFGEDMEVLFHNYRLAEGSEELAHRLENTIPSNQEDFTNLFSYIGNYFDLDSVDLNMSEAIFEWVTKNDIEGFFTDAVLPLMICSPNSYITLVPKEIDGVLNMGLELIDLDRILYVDDDTLVYSAETDINIKVTGNTVLGDYIVLNRDGGFYFTSKGDQISEILYNEPTPKYWFKLGGLRKTNHQGFYNSYFKGSIDKSVLATRILSDKNVIVKMIGNPITIMRKLPCPDCTGADTSCNSCRGSSNVNLRPSIGSVIYVSEFDGNTSNKTPLDDIITYIQPPLQSIDVQQKQYELHKQEVKEGLNNFYYKHSQSGVAKEIDRQDKVASTEVILYRLFTLASDILNAYSQIVTIDKQPVTIVTPYELVSDSALPLASSGMSANELTSRTLNYYKGKYKDDAVNLRLYTYAIQNDFLFPYTAEEKKSIGIQEQIEYSNQLTLAIMKVADKYKDRVRTATDKTIEKWLAEFISITNTSNEIVADTTTV
jgi:hypothetical protein